MERKPKFLKELLQDVPGADWLSEHNHRIAKCVDEGISIEHRDSIVDGRVKLFRYIKEPPRFPIERMSYWTDVETHSAKIVSGVTGIPTACCKYRIEWTFDAASWDDFILVGELRMEASPFPPAYEYENRRPVQEHDCTVVQVDG